jgi:hypothetical protein
MLALSKRHSPYRVPTPLQSVAARLHTIRDGLPTIDSAAAA